MSNLNFSQLTTNDPLVLVISWLFMLSSVIAVYNRILQCLTPYAKNCNWPNWQYAVLLLPHLAGIAFAAIVLNDGVIAIVSTLNSIAVIALIDRIKSSQANQ